MKERPILFSTPMVQAILAGRKTQTRRVVKRPFSDWFLDSNINSKWAKKTFSQCPYGQPGNLLWVRETIWVNPGGTYHRYLNEVGDPVNIKNGGWKKKPSIHMPKDAARIWLDITGVRVERLHEISKADAIAEGIFYDKGSEGYIASDDHFQTFHSSDPIKSFEKLWITINGEESWDANPWVWVVEFKVISTTGGKPCP